MRKKTQNFLFLISFLPSLLIAQTSEIRYPDAAAFKTYLIGRSADIQQNLYRQCLQGVFTLYKTDSLLSRISAADFKLRGAFANNSYDELTPLRPEDLSGMWFTKQYSSPLNSAEENDKLSGLALMFQPVYSGHVLNKQPLVWLRFDELKTRLPAEDYQFLVYLAKFASAGNAYQIWENDDLPYFDLFERRISFLKDDSFTIAHMSRMLESGSTYIDLIRQNLPGLSEPERFLVFDEQSKKQIALSDIGNTYQQKMVVFISTDPYNPTKGYDTTYMDPQYIRTIDKLIYNTASGTISEMKSQISSDQIRSAEFKIPRKVYQSYGPGAQILWFLDDYCSWLAQHTGIQKK